MQGMRMRRRVNNNNIICYILLTKATFVHHTVHAITFGSRLWSLQNVYIQNRSFNLFIQVNREKKHLFYFIT